MTAAAKKTVWEALAAIMDELPAIPKMRKMTEGPAKYSYRGIEDIDVKLKPLLAKHGVTFVPRPRQFEVREMTTKSGARNDEVLVLVDYTISGPDGTFVMGGGLGQARDTSDKAANKAMTAAYKQVLTQTLCIVEEADDQDNERPPEPELPLAERAASSFDGPPPEEWYVAVGWEGGQMEYVEALNAAKDITGTFTQKQRGELSKRLKADKLLFPCSSDDFGRYLEILEEMRTDLTPSPEDPF